MKIGTSILFFKNLVIKVIGITAVILLFTNCGRFSVTGPFINSSRSYTDVDILIFQNNGIVYIDGVQGTYEISGKVITIKGENIPEINGEIKDERTIIIDRDTFNKFQQ